MGKIPALLSSFKRKNKFAPQFLPIPNLIWSTSFVSSYSYFIFAMVPKKLFAALFLLNETMAKRLFVVDNGVRRIPLVHLLDELINNSYYVVLGQSFRVI